MLYLDDFITQIQSDEVAAIFASWYREEENNLWEECFENEQEIRQEECDDRE